MTEQEYFDRILPARLGDGIPARAYAPANIALCKYWGKRDRRLNLPNNGSLSVSLAGLGSHTAVSAADRDRISFNGEALAPEHPFCRKILRFVGYFRRGQTLPLRIDTENTLPTAAGLASSASGFAALTLALCAHWQLELPAATLSTLARIGSGSACRSLWHGFVRWRAGEKPDGSDSHGIPLPCDWQELRIALLHIDDREKSTSSRDGMNHTTTTSPLYSAWIPSAERDLSALERAVADGDFHRLGQIAEGNALAMHATMMAARPALMYLRPESFAAMVRIRRLRDEGLPLYFTADAGPNLKLLYPAAAEAEIAALFPDAERINPFAVCENPLG